jgi:WD40 repeat protein
MSTKRGVLMKSVIIIWIAVSALMMPAYSNAAALTQQDAQRLQQEKESKQKKEHKKRGRAYAELAEQRAKEKQKLEDMPAEPQVSGQSEEKKAGKPHQEVAEKQERKARGEGASARASKTERVPSLQELVMQQIASQIYTLWTTPSADDIDTLYNKTRGLADEKLFNVLPEAHNKIAEQLWLLMKDTLWMVGFFESYPYAIAAAGKNINYCKYNPQGTMLALRATNTGLYLYDITRREPIAGDAGGRTVGAIATTNTVQAKDIAFNPQGSVLVYTDHDMKASGARSLLNFYTIQDKTTIDFFSGHYINNPKFNSQGTWLVFRSNLKIWLSDIEQKTVTMLPDLLPERQYYSDFVFVPHSNELACLHTNGTIDFYDVIKKEITAKIIGYDHNMNHLMVNQQGTFLSASGIQKDGMVTVNLYDIATRERKLKPGVLQYRRTEEEQMYNDDQFNPQGTLLLSNAGNTLYLYDVAAEKAMPAIVTDQEKISTLTFNERGTLLAFTGSTNANTVNLYDMAAKKIIPAVVQLKESDIDCCAFALQDTVLSVATYDGSVAIFTLTKTLSLQQLLFVLGIRRLQLMNDAPGVETYIKQLRASPILATFNEQTQKKLTDVLSAKEREMKKSLEDKQRLLQQAQKEAEAKLVKEYLSGGDEELEALSIPE